MAKNRACPKCQEIGHDKAGDHLYEMADGLTWKCPKNYHEAYYERNGVEWTMTRGAAEEPTVAGPSGPPVGCEGQEIRKIPKEVIDEYGVKVECSMVTGDPVKHWYPITTNKGKETISWKTMT